ncbi:histidine kinase dimerization/phospho-acceptor domain-containing protein [Pseudomonas sp.]|nr:histidine kinase dimerization/phospho-acceptor domain-containing protein [Pseudomonas sp.]
MVVSRQVPCVIDAGLLSSERAVQDKHADAAQRALLAEQMLGIVAHDLRNPLLAIKMATEILARQPQDARTCQLLEHITHSAERAERLVADLLD